MNPYHKIRDFHAARAKGVGASDIPTLAGLAKRWGSTPMTLWEEKTGRAPRWRGNQRTYWGNQLEGLVLRQWVDRAFGGERAAAFYRAQLRGRSIGPLKIRTEARHPEYRYALAHADLIVDSPDVIGVKCPKCGALDDYKPDVSIECSGGCGKIICAPPAMIQEAKTAGFFGGKRDDDPDYGYSQDDFSQNGIPAAVFLQVQWQLFCYGIDVAGVSVLIDTGNYAEYGPIIADPRMQEKCLALADRFWQHVTNDTPPKPETWNDVCKLYPEIKETTAMIGGAEESRVREMVARKKSLVKRQKQILDEIADMKNAIGVQLQGNKILTASDGEVFAKASERSKESIALKPLISGRPDLYETLKVEGFVKKSEWREVRF